MTNFLAVTVSLAVLVYLILKSWRLANEIKHQANTKELEDAKKETAKARARFYALLEQWRKGK